MDTSTTDPALEIEDLRTLIAFIRDTSGGLHRESTIRGAMGQMRCAVEDLRDWWDEQQFPAPLLAACLADTEYHLARPPGAGLQAINAHASAVAGSLSQTLAALRQLQAEGRRPWTSL